MREHVDLPTLHALEAEWSLHPPVHHLVAAYLNYKPPVRAHAPEVTDAEDMAQDLGPMEVRKVAPLDTAAFDAQMKALNG